MARSRSFPVALLREPDYFELASETKNTLFALVLLADDEGRGLAHRGLLARDCNQTEAGIETALCELVACELLQVYQVGRHHYYALTRWDEWQTLSKPTPSRYPAPPARHSDTAQDSPGEFGETQESPGEFGETPPEVEGEEERKGREEEDEEPRAPAGTVIPFRPSRDDDDNPLSERTPLSPEHNAALVAQLAEILRVEPTEGLRRVVAEYKGHNLLGEADAAREWIDDPGRNKKRTTMSLAFFRRWVEREARTPLGAPPRASPASSEKRRSLQNLKHLRTTSDPSLAPRPWKATHTKEG